MNFSGLSGCCLSIARNAVITFFHDFIMFIQQMHLLFVATNRTVRDAVSFSCRDLSS